MGRNMANVRVEWDLGDIPKRAKELIQEMVEGIENATYMAVTVVGNEANKQVPFDVGNLSDSWDITPLKDEIGYECGFHTPYAERMHEHPEYRFKNGRKAKYLEDPIENNEGNWKGVLLDNMKQVLR